MRTRCALSAATGRRPRFGLGFRSALFDQLARRPRQVDWLEVIADNYIGVGGARRAMLARVREDSPVGLHGLSLSIAGSGPLPEDYLSGLQALADWLQPAWVSDHLCWTAFGGHQSHDLLPVAYTEEVLAHVAARVVRVQERLGRQLLLENATAYVAFRDADMTEAEFFAALCRRTGCGMLLDVNNLFVNAANLGVDPLAYLETIPPDAVGYMHLAGHAILADVRIDTHGTDVSADVWTLFDAAARRFPSADVIVERDEDLPPFACLVEEVEEARRRHGAAVVSPPDSGSPRPAVPVRPAGVEPARWTELQREFWGRLVDAAAGDDGGPFDDARPVRPARGMRVYTEAYAVSLGRALATNFPTLAHVLGPTVFDRLATVYLRAHPPRGFAFLTLGVDLAAFLRTYGPAREHGIDPLVLAEIAAVEQAQLEVADAPDAAAGVTLAELAAMAPERWEAACFDFVPAVRVVCTSHDVLAVVEAAGRRENPERPVAAGAGYLLYRSGALVGTERIGPGPARVLERLLAGLSFGSACAEMPEAVTGSAGALAMAARLGLVAAIRLPAETPAERQPAAAD